MSQSTYHRSQLDSSEGQRFGQSKAKRRHKCYQEHDDSGASLILALVFLIVVGLIVISIAGLTATDLRGSTAFANAQATTAAADGVTTAAIQYSRYNFQATTLNNPAQCDTANINGQNVTAWCETLWHPFSASTRFVTVSTCLTSVSMVSCVTHPFLQAIVVIDDYPESGNSSCVPGTVQSTPNATCGTEMVQNSWVFNVIPPVVQAVSPGSGCPQQASITITGTGFTPNSRVSFVSAANYASNVVYYASNVNQVNATSISATSPAIPSGSGVYYVIVTGLTGSNVFTSSTTWTC